MATRLLTDGASELALAVDAVVRSLDFGDGAVPLVLAGSLLVEQERYRATVLERLWDSIDVGPVEVVSEPALVAAQRLAWMVDQ